MSTETKLTQQQADAIECAYPMHGDIVANLIERTEQEALARAELAMSQWRASNPGVFEWLGGVA